MKKVYHPRFLILPLFGVILFGTIGYMSIERWNLLDGLYMTVITLATVGFEEVHPLDASGKLFTIILITTGVVTITFCLQMLVRWMVESNFLDDLRKRRLLRRMKQLNNHTIVCGFGRIGQHVAASLRSSGRPFVVIDRELPEEPEDNPSVILVRGEATDENLLIEAGVERAETLVTVVGSDADNLFIVMSARTLNPKLRIVSRAADKSAEAKLMRAGADKVICPYEIGGRRIASFVTEPIVSEFLDTVMATDNIELRLEEITVVPTAKVCGRSIADSHIREESGAIIIAVKKRDGSLYRNPDPKTQIEAGDTLIGLGTLAQLEGLRSVAGKGK